MLNLSRQEDMLTQGQSPADRVLANPNAQTEEPVASPSGEAAASASQAPAAAGSPPGAAPDVQMIARRVYELMRQDLLILHERRGLQNSSRPGR